MAHRPRRVGAVYAARAFARVRDATRRPDVRCFFSRFAPTARPAPPTGPGALLYSPAPAAARGPSHRCPQRSGKESLGAACAPRANTLPGARSAPSCAESSANRPTRSGSRRSRSRRGTAPCSCSRPARHPAWVANRFGRVLERLRPGRHRRRRRVAFAGDGRADAGGTAPTTQAVRARERFNPRYSFEQFIIGDGNRLAHAAALAVAELPGQAYNPLFLHAPPGLGKTHLLHAIGNYVSAFGGGATVRYTTVEAFTNHFIARARLALARPLQAPLPRCRRPADRRRPVPRQQGQDRGGVLPHLQRAVRDRPAAGAHLRPAAPAAAPVEERLRERFESGLVADIRPPDLATRMAILRKRVALDRIELADAAVLELIAERVTDNIRALEGALIRIVAHHSLTGRPIDAELASRVLDTMYPSPRCAAAALDRRDPARSSLALRVTVAELISAEPHRAHRLAPSGRDLPRPRAHRPLAAGDRRGVRRSQPRHRAPRLQARVRAHLRRPTPPRRTPRAQRAPAQDSSDRSLDRLACPAHATTFPLAADENADFSTVLIRPMTSTFLLRYSS